MMELGNLLFGNSRGKYEVPRHIVKSEEWQRLIMSVCDEYGLAKPSVCKNKMGGFSNDIFEINPYYFGECNCGAHEGETHKKTCVLLVHNFVYKPIGFWIDWYKYPFRDAYMSHYLSEMQIRKIFDTAYRKSFKEVHNDD